MSREPKHHSHLKRTLQFLFVALLTRVTNCFIYYFVHSWLHASSQGCDITHLFTVLRFDWDFWFRVPSQLVALQFARLTFSLHPPIKGGWPARLVIDQYIHCCGGGIIVTILFQILGIIIAQTKFSTLLRFAISFVIVSVEKLYFHLYHMVGMWVYIVAHAAHCIIINNY